MAKAYEESFQHEEELKRTSKLPMELLPMSGNRKRELLAARIEVDVYVSTVKDEQLHKLAETFKVPEDIKFHLLMPS